MSTSDPDWHDRIVAASRSFDAAELAEQAPRRAGWAATRLGVMATLLRAKYTQHPPLAQTLRSTADARIRYVDHDSAYWVAIGQRGTNWIGRLLEVVRSELVAADAGITVTPTHDTSTSVPP